jgi:hypothetical protein
MMATLQPAGLLLSPGKSEFDKTNETRIAGMKLKNPYIVRKTELTIYARDPLLDSG